jgi:hypothetical protein
MVVVIVVVGVRFEGGELEERETGAGGEDEMDLPAKYFDAVIFVFICVSRHFMDDILDRE